jgi:hypothetical protein
MKLKAGQLSFNVLESGSGEPGLLFLDYWGAPDLLFKKPWTLSRKAEFMLGIGPQWVHLRQGGRWTNTLSGELAGDFMFWPTGKHHFGWILEPAYDYRSARGHQKSLGISFGLLIGLR